MAINTIADLSTTPSNNVDLLGQNSTGGANANTIDTLVQNLAAMMARAYGDVGGLGTVGGSANAITLTSLSTYQALEDGLTIAVKAASANTGASTLNLDGLGARAIRKQGDVALAGGEIAANGRYQLIYDEAYNSAAGAWVLLTPGAPSTDSATQKLTNKRIKPRVLTIISNGTPTVNTDSYDAVDITALATAITSMTANLSGTPDNFDKLLFRIKDNGTARAITWGSAFEARGQALPTTTVISKVLTVGFIYDSTTSRWGCVAAQQEA